MLILLLACCIDMDQANNPKKKTYEQIIYQIGLFISRR